MAKAKHKIPVVTINREQSSSRFEVVAGEEPLEIRLKTPSQSQALAITMRTPGNDFELAAGWLLAEGVIDHIGTIKHIGYCTDEDLGEAERYNTVTVTLKHEVVLPNERRFYSSSACGVCGSSGIGELQARCQVLGDKRSLAASLIAPMAETLRQKQRLFDETGGLHAAGLFDQHGRLLVVREDIGRHNAVDKVIGHWRLHQPASQPLVLLVSGRIGFEIAQKAIAAGIAVLCAIGAPSNLAVQLAERFQLTLVGFVRDQRFHIYSASQRIMLD
jgi:FdhD protein